MREGGTAGGADRLSIDAGQVAMGPLLQRHLVALAVYRRGRIIAEGVMRCPPAVLGAPAADEMEDCPLLHGGSGFYMSGNDTYLELGIDGGSFRSSSGLGLEDVAVVFTTTRAADRGVL